jgi:hypothetical protein
MRSPSRTPEEIVDEVVAMVGPDYHSPYLSQQKGFSNEQACRYTVKNMVRQLKRHAVIRPPTIIEWRDALLDFEKTVKVAKVKTDGLVDLWKRRSFFLSPVPDDDSWKAHDPDPTNNPMAIVAELGLWLSMAVNQLGKVENEQREIENERRERGIYKGYEKKNWPAEGAALNAYQLLLHTGTRPTLTTNGPYIRLACLLYEGATGKYDCTSTMLKYCREWFHHFANLRFENS